ncbi:hypothetical protein JXA85_00610, partial [Candidatus Woesearchaeota archaeon]|nr:hypothetical protein [Candidatus Woesearchaeota archaeon]
PHPLISFLNYIFVIKTKIFNKLLINYYSMPNIFNSEKDIEQELKLKLIMIEQSTDDPVLELKLIDLLYQIYKEYNIRVPKKIEDFLAKEKERIVPLLKGMIDAKKQELNSLVEKREQAILAKQRQEEEMLEEEKEKHLSRTQLIFGDKEF